MRAKHKFQWYQHIYESTPRIHEDARKAASGLGLEKIKGKIGLYPGSSSCPGPLPEYVLQAILEANLTAILPMRKVEDQLRELVKDIYGDDYDGAATNTCEAALRVTYETLFAPPTLRKGDTYRARFIAPYEEDFEFMAGYGRPFPPRYKNLLVDRSVTAGELGVEGKSLPNLDAVLVKLAGAKYEVHGIKYNPVPLLTTTDAARSRDRMAEVAARHAGELVGFVSIGYDTPGYGYGEKDERGAPRLKKMMGDLARDFDVPYVVDSASCVPVIGLAPGDVGAEVMVWSMDKAAHAPICGLIIGREESMVAIRKGLGLGGQRYGEVSSHGKAVFSLCDPGRDAVAGLLAVLKTLRDDPGRFTRPIDRMHAIVVEEFESFRPRRLREKMIFTKSYSMGGTEINYEQTWDGSGFGIPLFTLEDMVANTNPIMSALEEMGVYPATVYSGNMFLAPGQGNLDRSGELLEEPTRLAVRALVSATEIVCRHAGLTE